MSEANNSANRCRRSISYLSGARPQPLLLLLLLLLVMVVFAMMMMETIVWNDGRVAAVEAWRNFSAAQTAAAAAAAWACDPALVSYPYGARCASVGYCTLICQHCLLTTN